MERPHRRDRERTDVSEHINTPAGPMPVSTLRVVGKILIFFAWWDVVWLLHLGTAWLLGGEERLSGLGFSGLRQVSELMNVSPMFWGWVLIAAGISLAGGLIHHHGGGLFFRWAGYVIGALCAGSLTVIFQVTVWKNPTVGATGPPTYLFVTGFQLGMLFSSILTSEFARRSSRERE